MTRAIEGGTGGLGTTGLIGTITAALVGGIMLALAASTAQGATILPAAATFTVALAVAAVAFERLFLGERLRWGWGPCILFWSGAFPAVRLAQELVMASMNDDGFVRGGLGAFLVYQALVGGGFGLGFLLLYQQVYRVVRRGGSTRRMPADDAARQAPDELPGRPKEAGNG